jgi:single-stranded-DNA-specific exonuclease
MRAPKTWVKRPGNEDVANILHQQLKVSLVLARLLSARGIADVSAAKEFLQPRLSQLVDPSLFADMDKATERIIKAILAKERIGVFGDYDVDGVTSTAILKQFLDGIGASVVTTLPNRMTEGYGLSRAGVDRIQAMGASILITVDCGILAHEQIDYANSLGLSVIVVDHHHVGETLPNAYAVVNPKRADCKSQADYLCAAGVTFFVCLAVRRSLRAHNYFLTGEPDMRSLLDLVALATVCDVVPLVSHNRILVKSGLSMIKQGKRVGLSALMDVCGIDKEKISSTNLGFHLGPRINAAGRLEDATVALLLLGTDDEATARGYAQELNETNVSRKALEEETVEQACKRIDQDPQYDNAQGLVLYDESWHPGVVGIVASRIAERYHRPAIVIGQKGKGSGRSIKGIDLHDMVTKASHSLAGFGGHAHAIGLTLGPLGVEAFRADLLAVIKEHARPEVFTPELLYDDDVSLKDINLALIDELALLDPFGAKNPHVMVRINNCSMRNLRRLNGGHLKGELETDEGFLSFIGFRMDIDDEWAKSQLDVVGVLEKNEWQGRVLAQLRLVDYKKPHD